MLGRVVGKNLGDLYFPAAFPEPVPMCGRYSEHVKKMRGWADLLSEWARYERERRNIAPTQTVGVISTQGLQSMRWGLVPAWSSEPTTKYATFNARLEDVANKPAFRAAWKQSRRCLIPAGGYYEWKTVGGRKQPYFVHRKDDGPVVFGGLWEHWSDPQTGESVLSCSILTKPPTGSLAELHSRMPVMLAPEDAQSWLAGDTAAGARIADAANDDGMGFYAVSPRVNNSRVEGEDLTRPLEQAPDD